MSKDYFTRFLKATLIMAIVCIEHLKCSRGVCVCIKQNNFRNIYNGPIKQVSVVISIHLQHDVLQAFGTRTLICLSQNDRGCHSKLLMTVEAGIVGQRTVQLTSVCAQPSPLPPFFLIATSLGVGLSHLFLPPQSLLCLCRTQLGGGWGQTRIC